MPFELPPSTEVKLLHVNHRYEFHGEDRVLAVDLNFEREASNDQLDLLDPALRLALYCNRAATDGQASLPEVLKVLPNLRLPHLNGQKFKWHGTDKFKGYDFTLDYGLGDDFSNIDFENCAVGKWEFETKEGGSSVLRWQVSYAGIALTDEALTKLIRHEQKQCFIELKAPDKLVLVKGGKVKAKATAAGDDDQDDLLDEGYSDGSGDGDGSADTQDTPLAAMQRGTAAA